MNPAPWTMGLTSGLAALLMAAILLLLPPPHTARGEERPAAPATAEAPTATPVITPIAPIVKGIEFQGLRRIDQKALELRLTQRTGGLLDPALVSADIKTLFATGYFEDVVASIDPFEGGVALIYTLTEKPTLFDVDYYGNKKLTEEDIDAAITLRPGAIADRVLIQDTASNLQALYESKGYPLARVIPVYRSMQPGSSAVTFVIEEGSEVRIKALDIEGNEAIGDRTIKRALRSRKWRPWHLIFGGGTYERPALALDREIIQDMYHDLGRLEADVREPRVEFSPDGKSVDIAFEVLEGPVYEISSIGYEGNHVYPTEEVAAKVEVREGGVMSKGGVGRSARAISEMYSDAGYAMVSVYPDVSVDAQARKADVVYRIREGELYSVGRINIRGNVNTMDKVIRREVRLMEGDRYDGGKLRRSYERIMNLQYFDNVTLDPVPRVKDRSLDLDIDVTERSTGSIMFGMGYSSQDKFVASIEYTQGNLGGRGQTLKAKGQAGNISSTYDVTFIEPWLFDREVSFTARAYRETFEETYYDKKSTGGTVSLGKALGEFWSVSGGYQLEEVQVREIDEEASSIIWSMLGTTLTSSVMGSIGYDTRDNSLETHRGVKYRLGWQLAGLGGDNKFYKAGLDLSWYLPVTERTTLGLRGRYSQAHGLFGEELPLFERYYVGGISTIRGHRDIGPVDEEGDYIGGKKRAIFNADYVFPLIPSARLNGVTFFDAGNAFDDVDEIDVRYSAGAGIKWVSPFGPIRLEWAYNLDRKPGESSSRWEFTLGTFF